MTFILSLGLWRRDRSDALSSNADFRFDEIGVDSFEASIESDADVGGSQNP